MTNSGGYNNADDKAAEGENDTSEAITESGEISTGANSNEIFSDSAPGEENSAADSDADADVAATDDDEDSK